MHDLIVLSDLHLGRGKNPETGRYHTLETFFYDDDLQRFCRWLCEDAKARDASFKLLINGDVFDLLRIEPEPPQPGAREHRSGAALTPAAAATMIASILRGHPGFVDALAQVVETGNEVVLNPGNHDIELQWPPVQDEIRIAIVARLHARADERSRDGKGASADPHAIAAAAARLRFEPWFYYEPGRVWIEHGSQYDPECAFRYPLRAAAVSHPQAVAELDYDLPMGSFFQRYLYNGFGPITFIVPSSRANARYFKWLMVHQPSLLAQVMASHLPFAFRLVRRIAQAATGGVHALREGHGRELQALAEKSGLGPKLISVDMMKSGRAHFVNAVNAIVWQLARFITTALLVAFFGAGLWFTGFLAINDWRELGFGLKTLLFLGLNFLFLTAVAGGLVFAWLRSGPNASPRPLRNAAAELAALIGVPIVSFGHTHEEGLWRIDAEGGPRAWYVNTGTWIAVFTHDVLLPRERVQFTFMRVRGHEAELLHWSPGRGEPLPVVLLDEYEPHGLPEGPAAELPP